MVPGSDGTRGVRKLLCITAHPDDEAANFGGAVALYADQGVECELICLSAGEAARNRGTATDAASLQKLRRGELAESCRVLGFTAHQVWDLPDGRLPESPFYPTVGRLIGVIRRFQPTVVLCMGPEGSVTGHRDHAMSGTLATAAFHWAGSDRYFPDLGAPYRAQRLYYATAALQPPRFPPVYLPHPDVEMPIPGLVERKIAAFACHRTQAPLLERVSAYLHISGERELYHLAAGVELPAPGAAIDLFAGL